MKTAHHQNFVNPTSSCMQGVTQAHTNESSYVTWRIWNRAQSSFSCQEWSQRFPWKRAQGIRTVVQLMEGKCPRWCSNIKQAGKRGWVAFVEQEERIGGQRKSDWSSRKLSSVPSSAVQYHPIPATQNHSGGHPYATGWEALPLSHHNHIKRRIFPKSLWSPNPNGVHGHLCKLDCLH